MVVIKLYDLIQSRGLTQRVLAQEGLIRESTISDMCNNKNTYINIGHLDRICKVLNYKIEDILEYIPDEKV